MMEKLGWRPGEGLGKNKQGMNAALTVTKVDSRTAVITTADPWIEDQRQGLGGGGGSIAGRGGQEQPTRVLLLTNMVRPGDVDEALEDETAEECSRYGSVARVVIFEVTDTSFPEEEAVRIFVEFKDMEACAKAHAGKAGCLVPPPPPPEKRPTYPWPTFAQTSAGGGSGAGGSGAPFSARRGTRPKTWRPRQGKSRRETPHPNDCLPSAAGRLISSMA